MKAAISSTRCSVFLLALLTAAALTLGCSDDPEKKDPPTEKLKVAFVYLTTPGDVGWTYAHELGRKEAEAALEDVEITYKENIVDDASSEAVIEQLVSEGNRLIFTTSWGYRDPTFNVAAKHPEFLFENCSGDKTATNMSSYFGRMYQARYLSGIVAGRMTTANKIGYVGAFPIPEVIRGINAFTVGVRSVNPEATVHVKWSNTWYDPGVEGAMAKALLDEGVDVVTQHQDSTATVMAAKERGAYAIGYNSDMAAFAPDTVLTTPIWKWGPYYTQRIKAAQDGTWKSQAYWGSLADGVVDLGTWGTKVPQAVKDEVAEKRSGLVAGTFDVFDGPLKKQDGTLWVDDGAKMTDAQMLSLMEFVEGVVGEVPAE